MLVVHILVAYFLPFQEIRHVLGSAGGASADGAPADDPVTSLDMFVGSDYLVAGHGSGQVFLWDYLRYTVHTHIHTYGRGSRSGRGRDE